MASKHLKKTDTAPQEEPQARKPRHTRAVEGARPEPEQSPKAPKKTGGAAGRYSAADKPESGSKTPGKSKSGSKHDAKDKINGKAASKDKTVDKAEAGGKHGAAESSESQGGHLRDVSKKKTAKKPKSTAKTGDELRTEASASGKDPMVFRRDRTGEEGAVLSHRDAVGAVIALIASIVLLAATLVIWVYRDSFSPDSFILSAENRATPDDEYIFDAGSGQAFSAAGQGLAVANASGLELLDGSGSPVTSMLMQMENPTAAGCDDYAVFYDLGGTRLAVARFDGTVEEIAVKGEIISATVSETGYLAVTTKSTGYRAVVTVYDPLLDIVYEWYSSSAWVMSGTVSPDGRKMAVLSYTASGSEVRFFNLSQQEQQAVFAVEDTVLLDVHWFSSSRLCALSSEQVFFFNANGDWQNTYAFAGLYLVAYAFDGSNGAAFALSPYRAGTTATLVSLDATGAELGTAEVNSEIVCLAASDLEIMVLCSDGAILYNSSLTEKGRLNGLPGFKYGLLRSRGEALLIASNYAEVYSF